MSDRPLWTRDEIAAALAIAEHVETPHRFRGSVPAEFGGVSIDSRTVEPGDLFVAIAGENHDGHDFVAAAIGAGAGGGMVAAERAAPLQALDLPLIIVPDPLAGLTRLAAASRRRTTARIVAVTGSVGKTSTKELIRRALATQGRTHASLRSFNNLWGVPLSLARLPRDAAFGVFEIGMNHPGEIIPLARLVRPQVAVITHVSEAHLEFFADLQAVAAAKAELFAGLEPEATAVLGADHEFTGWLAERALGAGVSRVVTYGRSDAAEVRVDTEAHTVRIGGDEISLALNQLGAHSLVNAAGALAVAEVLSVPLGAAARALETAKAEPGRGVVHHLAGSVTVIDESYNANPASMRAALAVLGGQGAAGRRIAVLGDMLELGAAAPALHAELAKPILDASVQKVILVGPRMQALADALPGEVVAGHAATAAEMRDKLLNLLASGDVVMVKGSNAIGLSALVGAIIERFGAASNPKS